jgi:hypothetical protein
MPLPGAQTIDDLLADPLITAVMRADGVERDTLKAMLDGVARKLAPAPVRPRLFGRALAPLRMNPAVRFAGCDARACG